MKNQPPPLRRGLSSKFIDHVKFHATRPRQSENLCLIIRRWVNLFGQGRGLRLAAKPIAILACIAKISSHNATWSNNAKTEMFSLPI